MFTATTAGTATTATALFTRFGDVHRQGTAIQIFAIESVNRGLCLFRRAHGDKAEAPGATGLAIGHQIDFNYGAVSGTRVLKVVFSHVEGKISNEQFVITHLCDIP